MESLFPELPEDLSGLSDQEVTDLENEHRDAAALIDADDEGFLKGMAAGDVISEYERGVEQAEKLVAEKSAREEAHENYTQKKAELAARLAPVAEVEPESETEDSEPAESEPAETLEIVAEEEIAEPEEAVVEERELVTAAVEPVRLRRPPMPSTQRQIQEEPVPGTALMAAGGLVRQITKPLDRMTLAEAMKAEAVRYGKPNKSEVGVEQKILVATAEFDFPEDRQLTDNIDDNTEKIRNVIVEGVPGGVGAYPITASGGLCAPLEPIYSMPNFATTDEPVWDGLPVFQARRGGVNVPEATIIGDITSAISSISEADDALGGTFATKSCQDLECPPYTEVAVQILAHCREYGNLNARAWPEKIAHENELTMAALSRTSEGFILDRIKAQSVNVTGGAETLGALIYLVDNIVKAKFGIQGRLRMPRSSRFRAYLPYWLPDMLVLDTIQTQFDRFRSDGALVSYLESVGIDAVFYLDTPSTGTTQLPDASQAAAAIDSLPDNVQWALHPQGAFLGIDSGSLELGIVRDSTLNSTNDFQLFGERFRNVVRIGPAQSAYWVTSDLCASGQFPPAGTARTCD